MARATRWDLDAPGSRFTSRAAIAVVAGESYATRSESGERDVALLAAKDLLGDDVLDNLGSLGSPVVVDGSIGRGAAGWTPVLEWASIVIIGGVIQGAAWDGVKSAAKTIAARVAKYRQNNQQVYVSRGTAALLAIDHILDTTDQSQPLDVELVEEPAALRGNELSELSYTGLEPWLVCLQNSARTIRYVIAIQPDGRVAGSITVPMSEFEHMFSEFPPRIGEVSIRQ